MLIRLQWTLLAQASLSFCSLYAINWPSGEQASATKHLGALGLSFNLSAVVFVPGGDFSDSFCFICIPSVAVTSFATWSGCTRGRPLFCRGPDSWSPQLRRVLFTTHPIDLIIIRYFECVCVLVLMHLLPPEYLGGGRGRKAFK